MKSESQIQATILMGLLAERYPEKVQEVIARIAERVEEINAMDEPEKLAEFVVVTLVAVKVGDSL